MDWCLRGDPKEYYMALVHCGARMAGLGKAGIFGDSTHLRNLFPKSGRKRVGCLDVLFIYNVYICKHINIYIHTYI